MRTIGNVFMVYLCMFLFEPMQESYEVSMYFAKYILLIKIISKNKNNKYLPIYKNTDRGFIITLHWLSKHPTQLILYMRMCVSLYVCGAIMP